MIPAAVLSTALALLKYDKRSVFLLGTRVAAAEVAHWTIPYLAVADSLVQSRAVAVLSRVKDAIPSSVVQALSAQLETGTLPYQVAAQTVLLLLKLGVTPSVADFFGDAVVRGKILKALHARVVAGVEVAEVVAGVEGQLTAVAADGAEEEAILARGLLSACGL
jgi:hypothetical protein